MRVVKPHSVSALKNRFANYSRYFVFVLLDDLLHRCKVAIVPHAVGPAIGAFCKIMVRHDAAEKRMHSIGIAKCHSASGIAVVAAFECDQLAALRPPKRILVLHGHLGSAFYSDAPGIGKEYLVQALR